MVFDNLFDLNENKFILNELVKVYKSPKDKVKLLDFVNKNIFFSKETKESFLLCYCKLQKIYFSLNKFITFCSLKKKTIVNFDMNLTPIYKNNKNIISIIHYNTNYLFNIIDIIKIIELSLCNSEFMFSKPKAIKNPFNNKEFNIANLYNIYFFIKFKTYYHSDLFHKFFLENFNLDSFTHKYECLLREEIIKKFVYSSSFTTLKKEILFMIEDYYYFQSTSNKNLSVFNPIDNDFPLDELIKIFRPYLYIYFQSKYSLVYINRLYNFNKFMFQMDNFWLFNPTFGRKCISFQSQFCYYSKKTILKKKYIFNNKHIRYNDNFLSTHNYSSNSISHSSRLIDQFNNIISNIYTNDENLIDINVRADNEVNSNLYYVDQYSEDEDEYSVS